jgi:DNA-binding NarL/FixJ family response regulator
MRVLLADDRPKTRFALRLLLERQPGIQVVGEAADAEELLVLAMATFPDVVLLDWELPNLAIDGSSLSALRRVCPHLCVIALSGRPGCICQQGRPAGTIVGGRAQCWHGLRE